MYDGETIKTTKVFDAEVIAAGEIARSEIIPLGYYKPQGHFSLQVEVTGDGTLKLEVEGSNNNTDFITPSAIANISGAFTSTSGPGGDGKDILLVDLSGVILPSLKIKATETGGANSATISAWLCIQ